MLFELNDALFGLAGGGLIGLSAAIFLLANGRIAGISGILGGVLGGASTNQRLENLLFLAGLIGTPIVLATLFGAPQIGITGHISLLIVSGMLVGIGTRLGGGCTSGHGVCGLSRVSPRSIVATAVFLVIGMATASLLRPHFLSILGGPGS
jgi:hypothetical protein